MKYPFNCPQCDHELTIELEVTETELPEHVYDHIMLCNEHLEQAVDFIFTKFTEIGVAVNMSGIKQILKYFDDFCYITVDELLEGEEDEPIQPEDTDYNQGEE